jgi:hypothetical protein
MLYPLSYEGGRWRKGGAKPPAAITASQATGRMVAARRLRVRANRAGGWLRRRLAALVPLLGSCGVWVRRRGRRGLGAARSGARRCR